MSTSLGNLTYICCVCENQETCSTDEIDLLIAHSTDSMREAIWKEIGPEYYDRLTEEEVNQAILSALLEDTVEQIKDTLEEEKILQIHDGEYIVNAMPR